MGKGNCDQVYSIVKEIRNSGNKTSYGIVDWDLKNKPESNIYVHGENERYSVENFILDPIYLVTLLIQLGNAHNICELTGLNKDDNEYLVGDKEATEIQRISNVVFSQIEGRFKTLKATENLVEIKYLNGKAIQVPTWVLKEQGHDIINKLKIVFPALEKYKNEGDLQKALIQIMKKSYPFVPLTSINLVEKLASSANALI
jgi:hypothetical protein